MVLPLSLGEFKLSEFPNLATYAQGFPTNITFSEGVGFLAKSSPEIHAAFEITAMRLRISGGVTS